MRLVVTGGGTGGHIFPALAIAEAAKLDDLQSEIAYMGSVNGMEAQIVPELGLRFIGLPARKIRTLVSADTLISVLTLFTGYIMARKYLRDMRPDAVLGTGGYVAAAAVRAACSLNIPTMILSPDAVPGRTNLMLAKRVNKIGYWLGKSLSMPLQKLVQTGMPVRKSVVSNLPAQEARRQLGLFPDRFTVLVVGGSQGAQRLNEIMSDSKVLMDDRFQTLHQVGDRNVEREIKLLEPNLDGPCQHVIKGFLSGAEMALAYRAADVMVCRSGVSSLAESLVNSLPMLMVPLPTAYADHQSANAKSVEESGAGICFRQDGLTGTMLMQEFEGLMNSPDRLVKMKMNCHSLAFPGAADQILAELKNLR